MYKAYDKLLFFGVSKVLSLHKILVAPMLSADDIICEIGFLFENNPEAIRTVKATIKVIIRYYVYSNNFCKFMTYIIGKYINIFKRYLVCKIFPNFFCFICMYMQYFMQYNSWVYK